MSIWDNLKKSEPRDPSKEGSTFIIKFTTESVEVDAGCTLQDALIKNAPLLGYDGNREVTWRDAESTLSGSTVGRAGQTYVAAVSLETKG